MPSPEQKASTWRSTGGIHIVNPLKRIVYRLYERQLLAEVVQRPGPRHLGLIQDGHRRYARQAGLSNLEGYRRGAGTAKDVLTWCAELKIPMVSLWWLSTENLAREPDEVAAVLSVIQAKMTEWVHEGLAQRLGIRIRPMGKLDLLPAPTLQVLQQAETATRDHDRILLNVGVGSLCISASTWAYRSGKVFASAAIQNAFDGIRLLYRR